MNDLCIFLNTKVENSETLAWIGDKGLAPFRYLFNGKTICIQPRASDSQIEIHHVASFHKEGSLNRSRTTWKFTSSSTGMIKTVFSVVCLIPGLLLAVSKALAYLYSDVRDKHRLVKEHFTPVNREIGSVSEPITNIKKLEYALKKEFRSDLKNHPTDALIIHGDGNLRINVDPGFLNFNPMKLVLEGAVIVHEPTSAFSGPLDENMHATGKWQTKSYRASDEENPTLVNQHKVNSVNDALQAPAPRRGWLSCKLFHMVFFLDRPPQTV